MEEANQLGRQLPPDAFYNELIRWAFSVVWHVTLHAWTKQCPPAVAEGLGDAVEGFCLISGCLMVSCNLQVVGHPM